MLTTEILDANLRHVTLIREGLALSISNAVERTDTACILHDKQLLPVLLVKM